MKNIFKQPLVHFLLVGLGFFLLFKLLNPELEDSKTIVVNKEVLLKHLQYRSKAFNNEVFEKRLAEMPTNELDQIIREYVREEALYREAMALGLDQQDYIIKRRMIQKVEFMTESVVDALIELTNNEVNQYYQENKENYFLPSQVTFTHIFFSFEQRNREQAAKSAEKEYKYLNKHAVPFEMATSRGDRFLYHTNYVERDPEYVASHFSKSFAERIFEASPSYQWIGPFESTYGYHLVMVTSSEPGRYPELTEIWDRVKQDTKYWQKQQRNTETIQGLIDTYEVKLEYEQTS